MNVSHFARPPARVNKDFHFKLLIEWSVDLITIAITQPSCLWSFALNRTAELSFYSIAASGRPRAKSVMISQCVKTRIH